MSCCALSATTGVCSKCFPTAKFTCVILSDTAGVIYRAFSARPTWLGGTGKPTTDPWTKNIMAVDEQNSLMTAGMCSAQAAVTAKCDINQALAVNCADPCNPAAPPMSITTMVVIVAMVAIVLIVGTNAFVKKEL